MRSFTEFQVLLFPSSLVYLVAFSSQKLRTGQMTGMASQIFSDFLKRYTAKWPVLKKVKWTLTLYILTTLWEHGLYILYTVSVNFTFLTLSILLCSSLKTFNDVLGNHLFKCFFSSLRHKRGYFDQLLSGFMSVKCKSMKSCVHPGKHVWKCRRKSLKFEVNYSFKSLLNLWKLNIQVLQSL